MILPLLTNIYLELNSFFIYYSLISPAVSIIPGELLMIFCNEVKGKLQLLNETIAIENFKF
jgi:hypothetical protein